MIQASTLQFLKALKKNNQKEWMDEHKSAYLAAKQNFLDWTDVFIQGLREFYPGLEDLDAKACMFRINRDIRFSSNKSPYKTNLAAFINPGGKKLNNPGFYVHLEPGSCFLAAGLYMPEPNLLAAVRQEIDYNLADWKKILAAKGFKKYFPDGLDQESMLTRPPKGYEAGNPALDWIRLKSFTVSHAVPDAFFTQPASIKESILVAKSAAPMLLFLQHAISA